MANYHDINGKLADAVEGAINALKSTNLTGVAIFKAASMTQLTVPRIEILCEAETEVFGDTVTGNYNAVARVRVITNCADGTRTGHGTHVAVLGDILFRDDFTTKIGTITNFTMMQWFPRNVRESIDGDEFITEFQCDAYCKPS